MTLFRLLQHRKHSLMWKDSKKMRAPVGFTENNKQGTQPGILWMLQDVIFLVRGRMEVCVFNWKYAKARGLAPSALYWEQRSQMSVSSFCMKQMNIIHHQKTRSNYRPEWGEAGLE